MSRATKKRPFLNPPEVRPGNWQGEILDGYTVSLGQVVQDGPPRQSIEFSYIVTPAVFTSPNAQFAWPGIVLIFAPTPLKTELLDAGQLLSAERLLSLNLSLNVAREQFSDMVRLLEANRLKDFHFTVEEKRKVDRGRSIAGAFRSNGSKVTCSRAKRALQCLLGLPFHLVQGTGETLFKRRARRGTRGCKSKIRSLEERDLSGRWKVAAQDHLTFVRGLQHGMLKNPRCNISDQSVSRPIRVERVKRVKFTSLIVIMTRLFTDSDRAFVTGLGTCRISRVNWWKPH